MKVKKRIIAFLVLMAMLLNMFSPYTILFNNVANAATGVLEEYPLILNNLGITKKGSNRILTVELALVSEAVINGFDFQFKVDTTKLQPCNKNTGSAATGIGLITAQSDYYLGTLQIKTYDKNTGTFHFIGLEPAGGTDIVDNGYVPGQMGDDAIDVNGAGYNAYYPVLKMTFKVLDPNITADQLSKDLFTQVSSGVGLPTGLKINYNNASGIRVSKDLQFGTKGFAAAEKTVTGISVKQNPNKMNYEHGDSIDLTGGVIEVTYDDGSKEDVDMTDSKVSIKTGSTAKISDSTVTLQYEGKDASFNINVTDPTVSLVVTTPMTTTEYTHGDNLNFAGLTLTATTKSGRTIPLTATSNGVTVSETQASVNSPNFSQTSSSGSLPTRGTQKIIFTYQGLTANQTIVVNDTISSFEVYKQPNKVVYKADESLDLTGAVVKVTLASGDIAYVNLPDGSVTVSGYNPRTFGRKQNLTVSINGKTATNTIDVEAYDYVTNSLITAPVKVEYKYNENLNLAGGKLDYVWKVGKTTNNKLSDSNVTVTGYDKTHIGTQTITVSRTFNYTLSDGTTIPDTITQTFEVEVTNLAKAITITAPTKSVYEHGDSLDLTGSKIVVTHEDGTEEDVAMTADMIKESDGSNVKMSPNASDYTNNSLTKTLVIEYTQDNITETINYPITINNTVSSIAMGTNPNKTTYNLGDTSYDLTNGTIIVTRKAGNTETVNLTDNGVTLTPLSDLTGAGGTKTVQVTYEGKTTSFNINVVNGITGMVVTPPTKTTYEHGDSLDLTGGKITITYADHTTQDVDVTANMVTDKATGTAVNMSPNASEYNSNNEVTKTLTISYTKDGQNITKDYTIKITNPINAITIGQSPRTNYNLNDSTTGVGGTLTVTRKAGNTETVNITDAMVSGLDTTTAGNGKTATITYESKTVNYQYNVKDNITGMTITPPTKTKYNHGDNLDVTGGKVTITYASGTTQDVPLTASMIKESDGSNVNMSPASYNSTQKVTKQLKIDYTQDGVSQSANYTIDIINNLVSIAIQGKPQTEYNLNDNLQQGLSILITRASGVPEAMAVTSNMITGFDTTTVGQKTATITYTENGITKTTTLNYEVKDKVKSISVGTAPKGDQKYNEPLDLAGATINVVKGSGTTTIPVTADMIKQGTYDPTTLGPQQVTIVYDNQEVDVNVTVKDYVTGITINPSTINGRYNDTLSSLLTANNVQYTVTYAKAGAQAPQTLLDSMVTGYNATTVQSQNLTVTYTDADADSFTNGQDFTANLQVNLTNSVKSIAITAPTKTQYNHGDQIATDGTITVTFDDNTTANRTMDSSMITEADGSPLNMSPTNYGTTQKISKTLKITYTEDGKTGTANYPIDIINNLVSIAIQGKPQTEYNLNDNLQQGLSILITRASGVPEAMAVTSNMITGFDTTTVGQKTATITYTENGITKTTTLNYEVKDKVKSISVGTAPKGDQKYNEPLDLAGATINVVKGSGTTTIPVTADMIKQGTYDPTTLGPQQVTIVYDNQEVDVNVTVKDYVTGITINPSTINGRYNDTLSSLLTANNVQYTVTYAKAGAQAPQTLLDSMVTGYNATTVQSQNLTVTYTDNDTDSFTNGDDFTANLQVNLTNSVKSIAVTAPSKTVYNHGDQIATDGVITVTFEDGTSTTRPMDSTMITEADGSPLNMSPTNYGTTQKISKTLKITYTEDGKTGTANYPIDIINNLVSIAIQGKPQTEYNLNDNLQQGLSILITRASGVPEAMAVTSNMITGFDTTTVGQKTATITYTENGITKTTTLNYEVKDKVKSISVGTAPKGDQKYNEPLDLAGATINVVKGSGTTTIPVTADMIKQGTYDPTTLGPQQVTIVYDNQEVDVNVTVKDYVTGITINPSTINGRYNDTLSSLLTANNVQYTVTYAKAGAQAPQTLLDSMVTGYNATTVQSQNLTVTYTDADADSFTNGQDFTANLQVNLTNAVKSISITAPTKTDYDHGDQIATDGVITVTFEDGTSTTRQMNSSMFIEADGSPLDMSPTNYGPTQKISKTLKITYTEDGKTGTVNYPITITNKVQSISIKGTPKDSYKLNEPMDGNITITIRRQDGSEEDKVVTPNMVPAFDTTTETLGTPRTSDIEYTENGETVKVGYTYEVTDTINSISIGAGIKYDQKYGENLDLTGATLNVVKDSGTTTIPVTASMIKAGTYDPTTLGEQTVTIKYGDKEVDCKVKVNDYIKGVVITPPSKITYKYNEDLDLSDAKISITMASNQTTPNVIPVTSAMISGYNKTTLGAQTVTITYADAEGNTHTQTFGVTVVDQVSSITLVDNGFKKNYKYGDNLDLTGLSLKVTTASGNTTYVPVTAGMVSGYDPTQLGNQTLNITYDGVVNTVSVNVVDYVKDITLNAPTKNEYKIGESLDLTGGSISEVMASGATGNTIALTPGMVTGFDSSIEGKKTLTVSYVKDGNTFNKTFQIAVVNKIADVEIIAPTKTNYNYGENLNLAGGSVKVTKEDGSIQNIPLTSSMVSGYDKTKPGQQMVKVTYTDEENNQHVGYFKVTVGDDKVTSMKFVAPTKKVYRIGETLDLTGGSISEVYASGKIGKKYDLTKEMISGFDSSTPGTKQIKVSFNGKTYNYTITVKDRMLGISIRTLPKKLEYNVGENLDLTGATLNVVKDSGTSIIDITSDMVSGFDKNKEGMQVITVSYGDYTVQFSVLVKKTKSTVDPGNNNNNTKPTTPTKPSKTITNNKPSTVETPEDTKLPIDNITPIPDETPVKDDTNKDNNNVKVPVIAGTHEDKQDDDNDKWIRGMLGSFGFLLAFLALVLFIIVLAKRRKNVKIYIEEGDERVLVGKEKLTKNDRDLDLNKYYNKYKEENYKVVLSKSISKKLDNKTVNLTVHDKEESFKVEYNDEEFVFKS